MTSLTAIDITKIATKIKRNKLSKIPGMDDFAITMNSEPTYYEKLFMKELLEAIEDSDFTIQPKEKENT